MVDLVTQAELKTQLERIDANALQQKLAIDRLEHWVYGKPKPEMIKREEALASFVNMVERLSVDDDASFEIFVSEKSHLPPTRHSAGPISVLRAIAKELQRA
jgi:hypothetical protein